MAGFGRGHDGDRFDGDQAGNQAKNRAGVDDAGGEIRPDYFGAGIGLGAAGIVSVGDQDGGEMSGGRQASQDFGMQEFCL